MKRLLSVIMCFFMLIGLFSCGRKNGADKKTPDGEGTKKAEQTTEKYVSSVFEGVVIFPDEGEIDEASLVLYDDVISLYRDVINICQNYVDSKDATEKYASELGITDEKEKELFSELLNYAYLQYPGRGKEDYSSPHYKLSCGYALKDLNGDGVAELVLLNDDYTVIAIFSVVDGKPVLLDSYFLGRGCWIGGDGLVRTSNRDYDGEYYFHYKVYKIADGCRQPEIVLEYAIETYYTTSDELNEKYYKKENSDQYEEISDAEYNALVEKYGKYLGESGTEATKKYSGLKFTPLFSESDIAMEMYNAALEYEIKVYETVVGEYDYLRDIKTPNMSIPLCECDKLGYAFADVDGDSINELVIDCGDALILRYYQGCVYVYPFTFKNMYRLNTDGSYNWNNTGQNFEYGEKQLAFEGAKLKPKEIWRIVNDGELDAEYYIGEKKVTSEELSKYIENIEKDQKKEIEFSALEVKDTLAFEEAMKIAKQYWYITHEEDGAAGSIYVYRVKLLNDAEDFYHAVSFTQRYRTDKYYNGGLPNWTSPEKELLINKKTGAITSISDSHSDSENYELSIEEARHIAEEYWNVKDGDIDPESGFRLYVFARYSWDETFIVDLSLFVGGTDFEQIKEIKLDCKTGEILASY